MAKPPVSIATVVAVVLAAAPLVLAYRAGWLRPITPAPEQMRAWLQQPLTTGFVTTLLQTCAWLLWTLLATSVAHGLDRQLRARMRWRLALRLPGPLQGLAAAVLGATAVTSSALPAAAHTGSTADAFPALPHGDDTARPVLGPHQPSSTIEMGRAAAPSVLDEAVHDSADQRLRAGTDTGRPEQGHRPAAHTTSVSSEQPATCRVERGDTLSDIAAQWLGDPDRWPEIFALNRGTHYPDVGGTLTNPDLIYPGWLLTLPDDATPPVSTPSLTPPPTDPSPAEPEQPAPAQPSPSALPSESPTAEPAPPGPQDDDDGVVEPAAPATESAAPTEPSPTPTTSTTSLDSSDKQQRPTPRPEPPGISLGGGSWLDLGLVTAILAAVALVWAHRRRRYTPQSPTPQLRLNDPSLAPMPKLVTRIRRSLRLSASGTPHDDLAAGPDATTAPAADDEPGGAPTRDGRPLTPALDGPMIEVWPPAGLGLTGPGAHAAARGFLVSALATGGVDDAHGRGGQVVIPSSTLTALWGTTEAVGLPDTPRLTVTDGLTDALTLLEEQTLLRTRLCFDAEVDTTAGLHELNPQTEPVAPMVLIADATAAYERARIAALLTQGQRLDIHGVLLGAWPDGDTVVVARDGSTSPADGTAHRHGHHPADVGRLTVIDPTDATDLLRVLAESHTGQTPPPPADDAPPTVDIPPGPEVTDNRDGTPHDAGDLQPGPAEPHPRPAPTADEPAAPPEATQPPITHDQAEADDANAAQDDDAIATGRVQVQVLGDARIVDMATTLPLRGKALELLTYLAARAGVASQETILEDLLPDAATSKAPHRLHTYVYNLRRVLASTGGPATYLTHPGRRYILHRDTLDVDLWRMSDALDEANRATTPTARIAALRRAVATYQGPLADGKDYEWIEPYREAVQRQAVDAALALADALHDQPGEALAVLTTAIGHHPHTEALHQAAMRAHAALGNPTAVRDLHRQLTRALHDIDTTVSDDTTALARTLLNQPQRSQPANGDDKGPS
ncbi:BTAD domain-containing putative transcriptional regulator [Verrucosispora sp. WMMA2044]|uniref:BTAD domain-containing putative transcriptional regulator n=1 Tax=Verrucosispora sp. WMMA2044 TaxID=3016419 RepID=UPI00248B15AF|nr:BTAD domain-containing putative transcriptional regulator [Verrucosispora sp. WMMA2044]WBB48446.1 BTAD domain-containing putative transcriptional regulator [Verrucosispora sp. WMMA2044]